MTQTVALPLWLFVILLVLAALAALEWLLLPGCAGISGARSPA